MEGVYELARWPNGTTFCRVVGPDSVKYMGGTWQVEQAGTAIYFVLMSANAQDWLSTFSTGKSPYITALIRVNMHVRNPGPILQLVTMNHVPAAVYDRIAMDQLLWVVNHVLVLPLSHKLREEFAIPRFLLKDPERFRAEVHEADRIVSEFSSPTDHLVTSLIVISHMGWLYALIGKIAPVNRPQSKKTSSMSMGHRGLTVLSWDPESKMYGLGLNKLYAPPYATSTNLTDLLLKYLLILDHDTAAQEWMDNHEDPGIVTYDDELYRLMNKDSPVLWPSSEFIDWAAQVDLEPKKVSA